jgi:Zn-dependent protease
MDKLESGPPNDEMTVVGEVFGAPLVVKGNTWLPVAELGAWGVMAWYAGVRQPERSWVERLVVGALTMPVVLGSEWCHNLAHAAAAKLVGKPMDALRVTWGMPLVVYYDIDDPNVTPRQHIVRSLGGPVFNILALQVAMLFRRLFRPGSIAHEVAEAAVTTNGFLVGVSLLPIPGIDGGPLLKWSLVEKGCSPEQADETVRKVNRAVSATLGLAGGLALKKRKWVLGGFLATLAAMALGVALGLLREKPIHGLNRGGD